MKIEIEIEADHIDWKELITKINDAISEEATDVSSVKLEFSECGEECES